MKKEWQRFAPIGLYIAGIAAIVALGLYIVYRDFTLPIQISLVVFVVGLAAFAILDPERVRRAFTGRQARYGSNAVIMFLAFIGILVVINYLVFKNPKRWDMTENQQYTLAEETIDTLRNLPEPVKALAFFSPQRSSEQAVGLLDQYKFESDGNFEYEVIDPISNPVLANQMEITRDGTIVLMMGDIKEAVVLVSEREITGGIVRLINPEQLSVYFLTGHGEYDPEASGEESYSQAKALLESKNYQVKTLNLLATNSIPEDASVIVIAGPTQPVSQAEVDQISGFITGGGSLMVMEEPVPVTQFGDSPDPLAQYLEDDWGILLGNDIVVDLTSNQLFVAVANEYANHPITEKMQGLVTFFPTVRSVTSIQSDLSPSLTELVFTASQSWAETDMEALQTSADTQEAPQIAPDEGIDILGPVPLALSAEEPATSGGRLVVFGDSDFASNAFFSQYGNGDIFTNAVDWAAEQEELINLTPKENIQRLLIPPQGVVQGLILLGVVFVIPGAALVAGIVVWVRKRRRG
jgi:ABC-type uncharacterized transport system involved in gliding motility auxiliary subunit